MRAADPLAIRCTESDRLLALLQRTEPASILISGEAGMGKTTLLDNALKHMARPAVRLRCHEEHAAPYAPLVDLLSGYGRSVPPADSGSPADRIITPVVQIMCSGDTIGCILIIEDLHWASPDALDLLPRLAEQLSRKGCMLVGSYRGEGLPRTHRLRWVRNELRRAGRLSEIELGPISLGEAGRIVAGSTRASDALVAAIHARSRGVPFYIHELAEEVARQEISSESDGSDVASLLPESIRDATSARLNRLPKPVQEQVFIVALGGTQLRLPDLEAIAGDPDALLESGFLRRVHDTELEFRHSLLRDAVRAEIPWSVRRELHRRIAARLHRCGAEPAIIAKHQLAAGDSDAAREGFLNAVERSEAFGAYRDAIRAGREALRLMPAEHEIDRVELLLRIARHEQLVGELSSAAQTLGVLTGSSLVLDDPQRRAEVHRMLAVVCGLLGDEERAFRARIVAEASFRDLGRPAEAAAELLQQLSTLILTNRLDKAIQIAKEAAELAEQGGRVDIRARALGLAGHILAMAGRQKEALAAVEQGFDLAVRHELSAITAETYRRLAGVLEFASEYGAAVETYTKALDQCRRIGAEEAACDAMGCMCYVLFRFGDWSRSLAIARELLQSDSAPAGSKATALYNTAVVRAMRGELRPAADAVRDAEQYVGKRGFSVYLVMLQWPRAFLFECDGADDAALREYRGLLNGAVTSYDRHDLLPCLCHASVCFARYQAHQELSDAVAFLSQIASEIGNPEAYASLAYCHGSTALAAERYDEAAARYLDAADRFERIGLPLERAHALYQTALAGQRTGEADGASANLATAAGIARRLGARPLLARITATLETERSSDGGDERAGGERLCGAPQDAFGDKSAELESLLSPRQLDVARLLMEGFTNKEIAARLYLSTRTVEMHVAHLFDRLNCRTRTEAARQLAERGLRA